MRAEKGQALIVTILFAFAVSLLLSIWLLSFTQRRRRVTLRQDHLQAFYTAEAGLAKAVWYLKGNGGRTPSWRTDLTGTDEPLLDTLFTKIPDTALLSVIDHGGFLEITSRGRSGRARRTVRATFGGVLPDAFDCAALVSSPQPLVVNGSVDGDLRVKVQPQGSVGGNVMVEQNLRLPSLNAAALRRAITKLESLLQSPHSADAELFSPQIFDETRPVPPSKTVFVNDAILMQGGDIGEPFVFVGPKTLISTAQIQVSGDVKIVDLILVAPEIKLLDRSQAVNCFLFSPSRVELRQDSGFSGQIFSEGDILISERAAVGSPSFILSAGRKGKIELTGESLVNGTVMCLPEGRQGTKAEPKITIGRDAQVRGLVYSHGPVELEGTVSGCVATSTFYGEPNPPDTLNFNILNGAINREVLSKDLIIPLCFQDITQYRVTEWKEL